MGVTPCPDCGREVSTRAAQCIHCGCPLERPSEPEPSPPRSRRGKVRAAGLTSVGGLGLLAGLVLLVLDHGLYALVALGFGFLLLGLGKMLEFVAKDG